MKKTERCYMHTLKVLCLVLIALSAGNTYASEPIPLPPLEIMGKGEPLPVVSTGSQVYYPSGTYYFSETDLSIPARSIPMVWDRTYRSNRVFKKNDQWVFGEPADGPMGYGWTSPWFAKIEGDAYINGEGRYLYFVKDANGNYLPHSGTGLILRKTATGYELIETGANTYSFNPQGRLQSIKDLRGNTVTLTYDTGGNLTAISDVMARQIYTITYNSTNRISQITDLAGRTVTYDYDGTGNLIRVSAPLSPNSTPVILHTYTYNTYHGLTTKTNALSETYTIEYYPSWQDKGITKRIINPVGTQLIRNGQQPTGQETSFIYDFGNKVFYYTDYRGATYKNIVNENGQVLSVEEMKDGQAVLMNKTEYLANRIIKTMDALGNITITQKDEWSNVIKRTDPLGHTWRYTYNSQNRLLTSTDPLGTITAYEYDQYGNRTKETQASGTPEESITTYTYNQYNELLSTTNNSAATTYTYNTAGKLTEIRDPLGNIVTMTYDNAGNLLSTPQPLIGTTTYAEYDYRGNPGKVTDPNGAITLSLYDALGRVKTVTSQSDNAVTEYLYTTVSSTCTGGCSSAKTGNIASIILPEGNRTDYDYDNAGSLTRITDNDGSTINYTYDTRGNRTKEEIKDQTGNSQKTVTYQYDQLNRMIKTINPDQSYTLYGYDTKGNRITAKDPNGNITTYTYDPLNRFITTTQPGNVITTYTYDRRGNLIGVTDSNNNTTTYEYDKQNRQTKTISPDTNTTTYTYDQSGNLKTKTDAANTTITYTYDAANRVTMISFPDAQQNIVYTYDNCINGKGRLCRMTDQSGVTTYEYSPKGQVVKETKVIDNVTYVTEYGYDRNGSQTTMTYPSGRTITYTQSNDRVTGIVNNAADMATNITYRPFGGMSSITYGNGVNGTIGYDNQYRIASIATGTAGSIQNLTYTYDANGNITGITNNLDQTMNKAYTYDPLDRMATATGPWGTLGWTYDGVGNRQNETANSNATIYSYTANKLNSTAGGKTLNFGYDSNGNTVADSRALTADRSFTYNQNQRLIKVTEGGTTKGVYVYNGNGQRAKKMTQAGTTIFHYDLTGKMMAESTPTGTVTAEYVFLNGSPFAKIEGGSIYYYHNDHLGTPMKMTDSNQSVVWQGEFTPFGEAISITGIITNNLRFPGQYYDAETGLNYNYFRDYNPVVGRYVESDPIGLGGGLNIYRYSGNNPLTYIDFTGLSCEQLTPWERATAYVDPNNKGSLIRKYDKKRWKKLGCYNILPIPNNTGKVAKIACCCNYQLIGYDRIAVYLKDVLYKATFRCCDDVCSKKCVENPEYKTLSESTEVNEGEVTSIYNTAIIKRCGSYMGDGSCGVNDPD